MALAELKVGPMEVDSAGELTGDLGVHNQGLELIRANARINPPELATALVRERDEARSEMLSLEAVAKVADVDSVEDASVRGIAPDDRVVVYLTRTPSGRSVKGFFAYDSLPKGEQHDPIDDKLPADEQVSRLKAELDAANARVRSLENSAAQRPVGPGAAVGHPAAATATDISVAGIGRNVPADYDDLTVEQVRELLDSSDRDDREAIVEYERQHANRKGVVEYSPADASSDE